MTPKTLKPKRRAKRKPQALATQTTQSSQTDQPDQPDQPNQTDQTDQTDQLSEEARWLRIYRHQPDIWVKHKLGATPAPYRSQGELQSFLQKHDGEHNFCRNELARGDLTMDPERSYQAEALRMIAPPGRYQLRWPNGVGKTTTLAWLVLWFIDCYPDGALVSTAGTWSQIRDQLWREIAYWSDRSQDTVVTEVNKTSINVDNKWFALGRASTNESTFEGLHSPNVMVIFDEAKAIEDDIWDAARRILRGSDSRLWWVSASTPGSPQGEFYQASQSDLWEEFTITAYESSRIGLDEIHADMQELGEDGPLFWSMDLGEFPAEGEDTILPLSEVQRAVEHTDTAEQARKFARTGGEGDSNPKNDGFSRIVGIDVARYGGDETVVTLAQGGWIREMESWSRQSLTHTRDRVLDLLNTWAVAPGCVALDDDGLGGGLTDMLAEKGYYPVRIRNGNDATRSDRYANWATEAWFGFRRALREGLVSLPDDARLINQLSSRKYDYDGNGRMRIQSKEQMRRKGLESPDRAESVIYATCPIGGELLGMGGVGNGGNGQGGDNWQEPSEEGVFEL